MTSQPLKGSVVLVTGATGQVGWGVAKAAQEAGAGLVLTVRGSRNAVERDFPGDDVLVAEIDLLDETAVSMLHDRVRERFGRIDHVVAPLGAWWQKGATLEQPRSELRSLLEAYVEAQLVLVKTLASSLRRSGGSYTLVTGAAAERVIPGAGLLLTAVAAQYGLSRTLRAELAPELFRFNELRIACRVERTARPGVVPAIDAGRAFVEVMTGSTRGAILRYTGSGPARPMSE